MTPDKLLLSYVIGALLTVMGAAFFDGFLTKRGEKLMDGGAYAALAAFWLPALGLGLLIVLGMALKAVVVELPARAGEKVRERHLRLKERGPAPKPSDTLPRPAGEGGA